MNPQHTIPTMKDGDFCLNESRPIATYLASKYGKDDKLYPNDVTTRAIIDQRLYFDMGVFYKAFGEIVVSISTVGKSEFEENSYVMICFIPKVSNHVWSSSSWRGQNGKVQGSHWMG